MGSPGLCPARWQRLLVGFPACSGSEALRGQEGGCPFFHEVPELLLSLQTMVLASGGQDGAICLWDVLTGSKVSHMYAHRGDVTSLTCTASCVISSGLDDVISIWDRSSGIKLYSIQQVGSGESSRALGKEQSRGEIGAEPLRGHGRVAACAHGAPVPRRRWAAVPAWA